LNKLLGFFIFLPLLFGLGACTLRGSFDFSFDPTSKDAKQGETFPIKITVQRLDGFDKPFTVSLIPPSGAKVSAPEASISAGGTTATLNVFVDPTMPPTSNLKVNLRLIGDGRQKIRVFTLKVLEADFEPVLDSLSQEIQQGQVFLLRVGVRRLVSFDQAVTVTPVLPTESGISASPVTIGANQSEASLTLIADPNAPLSERVPLKLKYAGGGREKTVEIGLRVVESSF
jgi:hypothetical protein